MAAAVVVVVLAAIIIVMAAGDREERFCTADARRGPNGEFYVRDPDQGCKFVDRHGRVVPDQGS